MPSPRQIGYVYTHNGTDYLVVHTALVPKRSLDRHCWHVYKLGPHGFRCLMGCKMRRDAVAFIAGQ
jgi:hypothetical protein